MKLDSETTDNLIFGKAEHSFENTSYIILRVLFRNVKGPLAGYVYSTFAGPSSADVVSGPFNYIDPDI